MIENLMKGETATLTEFMDSFERTLLQMAMAKERRNQKKAAELLGLKPTTLHMKLRRFKLIKHNTIHPS